MCAVSAAQDPNVFGEPHCTEQTNSGGGGGGVASAFMHGVYRIESVTTFISMCCGFLVRVYAHVCVRDPTTCSTVYNEINLCMPK